MDPNQQNDKGDSLDLNIDLTEGVAKEIKTESVNFSGFKMKDWSFYSSVMSMSSDKLMD